MPVSVTEALTARALLASLVALLSLAIPELVSSRVRVFVALIFAGVAVNIIVCGALSTPHDRYSARVLWVLVLVAIGVTGRATRHWTDRAAARELTTQT